jgi:hypothetical protein
MKSKTKARGLYYKHVKNLNQRKLHFNLPRTFMIVKAKAKVRANAGNTKGKAQYS